MEWQDFVEPWWLEQIQKIEDVFVDGELPSDFLHAPAEGVYSLFGSFGIVNHWYPHWRDTLALAAARADLSQIHDPTWGGLAEWRQIPGMDPGPANDVLPFSPTLVCRAERTARCLDDAGVDLSTSERCVHWGGGIGLETLLMRWWGATHTEYIIDLPVMSRIQHQYLGHELGFDQVHHATDDVRDGVINLVPLSSVELVPQGCDFFVAFHSLNESTVAAQRYVAETRNWFNADTLVLEWTKDHPDFTGSSYWMDLMAERSQKAVDPLSFAPGTVFAGGNDVR